MKIVQSLTEPCDRFIEEKQKKLKARSAGYTGSRLTHMARDGSELEVECSNDVWQCDHTRLDVFKKDLKMSIKML